MDQKEVNSLKNKMFNGVYDATHYMSYHAYSKALRIARIFLVLGMIFALVAFYPNNAVSAISLDVMAILFFIYIIIYYWANAKSKNMRAESKILSTQIAGLTGTGEIKGWHLYDGIYDEIADSLEITFYQERSFLGNIFRLVKDQQGTLPLFGDEIEALKYFLKIQQNKRDGFVVYGSMTAEIALLLDQYGITLRPIAKRYLTKPRRWDTAAATARLDDAIWSYPIDFQAYVLMLK